MDDGPAGGYSGPRKRERTYRILAPRRDVRGPGPLGSAVVLAAALLVLTAAPAGAAREDVGASPPRALLEPLDNESVPFCNETGSCGWTWANYPTSVRTNESSLWSVVDASGPVFVAVGSLGLILRSLDGGVDWTPVPTPLPTVDYHVVTRGPGGSLWVGTSSGEFLVSQDLGASWTVDTSSRVAGEVTGLAFPSPTFGYAVGPSGIETSNDRGASWQSVALPGPGPVRAAAFYSSSIGWLDLGSNGSLYYTNDSGTTWQASTSDQPTARGVAIAPVGPSAAWMLGILGTVFRTTDALHWTSTQLPTTQFTHEILVQTGTRAWVVSDDANLFYTADGGGCWAPEPVPNIPELYDVAFRDPNSGVVVGAGAIWYTSTAGLPPDGSTDCGSGTPGSAPAFPWWVAIGAGVAVAAGLAVALVLRRGRAPPPSPGASSPGSSRAAPSSGRYSRRRRYRDGG